MEVLIVSDPFREVNQSELHTLTDVINMPTMSNIYVDDRGSTPQINVLKVPTKPFIPNVGNPEFIVNKLAEMVEPQGIPIWVNENIRSGEDIEFYIHFHDEYGFSHLNAVMAFINYEQVPLSIDNINYQPLIVMRKPGTLQSVHAKIESPLSPGVYDLLLVGRTRAFSRLDGPNWKFIFGRAFTFVQVLKLVVKP